MKRSILLLIAALMLSSSAVQAATQELSCGVKKIRVENGKLARITHEDGTIHAGVAKLAKNWNFNGKGIKHRLFGDRIPCSTSGPSRSEIVATVAKRYTDDPDLYGMNTGEGRAMSALVSKLMKNDPGCFNVADAAKSTSRANSFFIDCRSKAGKSSRRWVTGAELMAGASRGPAQKTGNALRACDAQLRANATNPSTYDPSLIAGSAVNYVPETGRTVASIRFKAANSFGVESSYEGVCTFEGERLLEVTANPID